tara:strand:+ start:631 stop:792 length:162 start_codon:yes stop_codon:yes gene_type:complete
MINKNESIEKLFKVLAEELEKRGQMQGIVVELTSKILQNLKEIKENERIQQAN